MFRRLCCSCTAAVMITLRRTWEGGVLGRSGMLGFLASRSLCSNSAAARGASIPNLTESALRGRWTDLDPAAESILTVLQASDAPLIWHKHSSFFDHLREVWVILCGWKQPQATCRLGLLHSAYSNSFVSMNCFDPQSDRQRVAELIGDEAENLVFKFCSIDRQMLEETVLREQTIRREGYSLRHIHTGEELPVSGAEAAAFITETLADEVDQRFGWQSDLEAGQTAACWPGPALPTLRLGRTSRLAFALRTSGLIGEASLPPIFDSCSRMLQPIDEAAARKLYWSAISLAGVTPTEAAEAASTAPGGRTHSMLASLAQASAHNPFVAEPHIVRAQLLLQLSQWEEAEAEARCGVTILCTWGTQWDKRMPFNAWLNWGRCLVLQAQSKEWPRTHGGIESLGATLPRMRYRGLNTERSILRGAATD